MKSPSLEKDKKMEDNITKDVRNLFRIEKINDTAIKNIRNLFRQKKENEAIKDRVIRDITNLFEHEEEDCYRPVREVNNYIDNYIVTNSNNYIEYESNCDRNKTAIEEYLFKIGPYLKYIINNLTKSDMWKNPVNNSN